MSAQGLVVLGVVFLWVVWVALGVSVVLAVLETEAHDQAPVVVIVKAAHILVRISGFQTALENWF